MDAFVDPSYEYDAPMFVDFLKGAEQLDPEADKWFGKLLLRCDFFAVEFFLT